LKRLIIKDIFYLIDAFFNSLARFFDNVGAAFDDPGPGFFNSTPRLVESEFFLYDELAVIGVLGRTLY